jgi:hypothetical protein
MSGYTVTITAHGAQAGSQTTIEVDTASGSPRITELTVRPADGTGLSPDQLPLVDLPALILALTPPATPAIAAAPATESPAIAAAPAARTRGSRSRPAKAAAGAQPTRGSRRRGSAEERTTPARGRRRAAATAEPAEARSGRAYRRMPDQDQVVAAYQQAGSVTAVAEHFGVPRHTATGWLRRLRSLGVLESRSGASS